MISLLIKFVFENMLIIKQGGLMAKFKSSFMLAIIASPPVMLLEKINEWYFQNYDYVIFVFIAIFIDHIVGTYLHAFILKDFSLRKNISGFFTKTLLVLMVGVLVEGSSKIMGGHDFLIMYFSLVSRLMVFIYPAGSALIGISIITEGKFPPTAWIKKISEFNKNLDIKKFNEKEE